MSTKNNFDWAVIGAGPAGIAAVGKLIDAGIPSQNIVWLDPAFTVGDFGTKWRKVPSNTKVSLFLKFLTKCAAFHFTQCAERYELHNLDPDSTCHLHFMADPLLWVTQELQKQVCWRIAKVEKLNLSNRQWVISIDSDTQLYSKNVILAIGAEPKTLPFTNIETVPIETTFDPEQLKKTFNANDIVAVFGSSHSAILIIRNLLELTAVKKVINFYQSPLRYAIYLENDILFDDTGLKGTTADWARVHIDGTLPLKLQRVISNKESIQQFLPECTKVIYAVGFQKRNLHIADFPALEYNDKTGIIAPGLFGLGIAFPEGKIDRFGNLEYRVGLWKFMDYLDRIMPLWLEYST